MSLGQKWEIIVQLNYKVMDGDQKHKIGVNFQ